MQLVSLVSLVESASLERKHSIDCEFKVIYCMSLNINISIGLTGCSATFVCFYFDPLRRKGKSQRCSVITNVHDTFSFRKQTERDCLVLSE